MPKFEDKFVHFRWSDELKGKKVFYADDICSLERDVISNSNRDVVVDDGLQEQPFGVQYVDGIVHAWRFVYYDPNYETKLAYEQGKKIEFLCKDASDAWKDWSYTPAPKWLDDYEYRIMPEETNLVTKRELAKWLAMGNGEFQVRRGDQFSCFNEYLYDAQDANEPTDILCVRKWDDDEWHKPTREYLGL